MFMFRGFLHPLAHLITTFSFDTKQSEFLVAPYQFILNYMKFSISTMILANFNILNSTAIHLTDIKAV